MEEEIYYQIFVQIKGGKFFPSMDEFLDKKHCRAEWEQYVVAPLKAVGFEDNGNGYFVNFSGEIKDEEKAAMLAKEALANDWVAKNAKKVELSEIGPVMHFDMATGQFGIRDERHPKLPE